jgi:hypothetical protein
MIKIIKTEKITKNIKCNWNIIKYTKEPENNYNIISVVFFKKKELYKSFDEYINGLSNIIKLFSKVLKNYRLRIYYDDSVQEYINDISKNIPELIKNDIELYKYDIPFFRDDIYHKGVIGTLIRFLPLYNFKLHKVDTCIVFDIDNKIINYYKNIINFYIQNNIKFAYRSRFCYGIEDRISCNKKDKYNNKYTIIASFIYQSITLPKKIFKTFIKKLFIKTNSSILKLIEKCNIENKYEYGIDEIFLNHIHIKFFYVNQIKISVIMFNHSDIMVGIYNFIDYIKTNNELLMYIDFCKNIFSIIGFNCITKNIIDTTDINKSKDNFIKLLDDNEDDLDIKIKLIYNDFNKKNKLVKILKNEKKKKNNIYNYNKLIECLLDNIKLINIYKLNLLILNTKYENKQFIITNKDNQKLSFK